ncbi:MAG: hypothetical protein KDB53_02070 [Planctomycetes bacterium]|nr:hypothetical protein [Planctomycetota bacterium]
MSLMELLVVISIMTIIAGVAVGLIRKGDKALTLDVNAKLVRSSLRLARNSAMESGVGAMVRIEPEDAIIASTVVERGGNWHFEDETGARNTRFSGGQFVDGGKLGRCLDLNGAEIDLGAYPWYEAVGGFAISLWISPAEAGDFTLVSRESSFSFKVTKDGALRAEISVGGEQRDRIELQTRAGLVPVGAWTRVRLSYDRLEAQIEADGVLRARKVESRPLLPNAPSHLLLGSAQDGFKGRVDELRYDIASQEQTDQLSSGVDFDPASDLVVRFDPQGRLDDRFHGKAVEIRIESDRSGEGDEANVETIRVELSGAIR